MEFLDILIVLIESKMQAVQYSFKKHQVAALVSPWLLGMGEYSYVIFVYTNIRAPFRISVFGNLSECFFRMLLK
jgi:hypothetical protein